jgi:hypothetical protein
MCDDRLTTVLADCKLPSGRDLSCLNADAESMMKLLARHLAIDQGGGFLSAPFQHKAPGFQSSIAGSAPLLAAQGPAVAPSAAYPCPVQVPNDGGGDEGDESSTSSASSPPPPPSHRGGRGRGVMGAGRGAGAAAGAASSDMSLSGDVARCHHDLDGEGAVRRCAMID